MLPLLSEKKKKENYFITISLHQEGPSCNADFLVNSEQNFKSTKINVCKKPRATSSFQKNSFQIWPDVFLFLPDLRL